MLRAKKRSGRWYSRKRHFETQRALALTRDGITCRICGESMQCPPDENGRTVVLAHAHHWIAERWVRRFLKGADPHILANLGAVHPGCHAKATAVEPMLFAGNWVGFVDGMRHIGVDPHTVTAALSALSADADAKKERKCQRTTTKTTE